jgi:hypothetical protein
MASICISGYSGCSAGEAYIQPGRRQFEDIVATSNTEVSENVLITMIRGFQI